MSTTPGWRTAYASYRTICEAAHGNHPWLVTERRSLTFAALRARIEAVAGLLHARGIGIGERVVVASADDAETALLFVALVCNGATVVNLDPETAAARAQPDPARRSAPAAARSRACAKMAGR